MDSSSSGTSNKTEGHDQSSNARDSSDIATDLRAIITKHRGLSRRSVLASQIQKALPFVQVYDRRQSISLRLQDLSEAVERRISVVPEVISEKQAALLVPVESFDSVEIADESLLVPEEEEKLLDEVAVQSLPVSIKEKRKYRKCIVFCADRKSFLSKVKEHVSNIFYYYTSKFELWNGILKIIEGRYGAGVVSYFVFIRWLLCMNCVIFLLNFAFLIFPFIAFTQTDDGHMAKDDYQEVLRNFKKKYNISDDMFAVFGYNVYLPTHFSNISSGNYSVLDALVSYCHSRYMKETRNFTRTGFFAAVQNILQGTGWLEPTAFFLGSYETYSIDFFGNHYNSAVASLCTLLGIFIVCFFMMTQFSSFGMKEASMGRHKRALFYSNAVFSGWDYCIKTLKSASFQHDRFILDMKTNLEEDRRKKEIKRWSATVWAKLYAIRFLINAVVVIWVLTCYYIIYNVAVFQMKELQNHLLYEAGFRTFAVQYFPSATIIIINTISPNVFGMLIPFEKYHAQTEINISLVRNVFLWLSSVIVLVRSFHQQTTCKPRDLCGTGMNNTCRSPTCWETYVGQQLYKLSLSDIFVYIGSFLCKDVLVNFIAQKYDNKLTRLIGTPTFSLPTEVLYPVYSQTILWLGVFYSPMMPMIVVLKIILLFYIKKTVVLKYSVPSKTTYRASRFNSIYIMILMISFFSVTIIHCYTLESIKPSRGCGPFRRHSSMMDILHSTIGSWSTSFLSIGDFLFRGWCFLPAIVILCLTIYYYWGLLVTYKELAKRLKAHLVLQSEDKHFLLHRIAQMAEKEES